VEIHGQDGIAETAPPPVTVEKPAVVCVRVAVGRADDRCVRLVYAQDYPITPDVSAGMNAVDNGRWRGEVVCSLCVHLLLYLACSAWWQLDGVYGNKRGEDECSTAVNAGLPDMVYSLIFLANGDP
jgi:hypothetical protein